MEAALNLFDEIVQDTPPILSVSDASNALKRYVEQGFRHIRIRGEISGYKKHTSGHSYFAIKDDQSVMDAIAWRGTSIDINIEDGLEVIITGRITTFPGRSKYQLIAEKMEAAGKGALMALFLERKEKLKREGLFDRKRPLPQFPKRIGIITSPTGAVIRDILHRLTDRFPIHAILWPVQVQGIGSNDQICESIKGFNELPQESRPDVLILARGGGSLEDLWTFNEEAVVRAVFASSIPIISAIGHETDTTLCDFAADLRAPTPTAAAELCTPVAVQILSSLRYVQDQMYQTMIKTLRMEWIHLKGLARGLPQPQYLLDDSMLRIDDIKERLQRSIDQYSTTLQHKLNALNIKHPSEVIALNQMKCDNLNERLNRSFTHYYTLQNQNLNMLIGRLNQSNYDKILEKGFSWIAVNGTIINSASNFPLDAKQVCLNFHDGKITIQPKDVIAEKKYNT